jgi:hypothetical protein
MNAPASRQAAVEATHPCVRCGTPVPLPVAMCERCNPLGLKQPASSQAHGTVFLGIALAVVALAVLGRVALAGVGPFSATVGGWVSATVTFRSAGAEALPEGSTTR